MVVFTVVLVPLVPHEEPVMVPVGGGAGVGVGVGVGDGLGVGEGDGDGVGEPLGTEHSFTALLGAGSDPKVATVQVKVPFSVLKTNIPEAPNATLVGAGTEQVSG